MSFNQYSIYSIVSSAGDKSEKKLKKILELTEKFNHFNNPANVKTFLENELNMTNRRCYFNDCIITTKENKDFFLVDMSFGNENYKFYYSKERSIQ